LELHMFFCHFFLPMDKKVCFFPSMVKKCPNVCQIIASYDQKPPAPEIGIHGSPPFYPAGMDGYVLWKRI
jgi:hypothetical protein